MTGSAVRVELSYRLLPPAGAAEVPVRVLLPAGALPAGVTASVDGDRVPLALATGPSGMLEGSVGLSGDARAGDVLDVRLRYRVVSDGSGGGRGPALLRIPLLAVPWPPAEALPGTFTATVALPRGSGLEEGFPSAWTRVDAGGGGGATGSPVVRYRTELPVLPALVAFRITPSRAVNGARPRAASTLAAVLDAGFVFWGLFAVFGAVVVAYGAWMLRTEGRAGRDP